MTQQEKLVKEQIEAVCKANGFALRSFSVVYERGSEDGVKVEVVSPESVQQKFERETLEFVRSNEFRNTVETLHNMFGEPQ